MAEINSGHDNRNKRKSKLRSTRVDLTPMVDLGFLLIAFFMITTTLANPKTMEINMPYKPADKNPTEMKESVALTILPGRNHTLYYYEGIGNSPSNPPVLKTAYFSGTNCIRDIINRKKKKVQDLKNSGRLLFKDEMSVLIKPDTCSTYADLVGVLDEMNINNVKVYAIVDITSAEQALIIMTEAER